MDTERLIRLLEDVHRGRVDVKKAVEKLRHLPFEDLGFAKVDHHRELRQGFPEVIMGEGKPAKAIVAITRVMQRRKSNVLITRLSSEKMKALKKHFKGLCYHHEARLATLTSKKVIIRGRGLILIVCAGTSDIPVAEEAAITVEFMGNRVERLFDVGVAGIHRLLENRAKLFKASVIVVAAGMEGALPSVVAGMVDKPVIGVPTSIGYGTNLQGIAPLLGMLNSCAAGVVVVNIDNGFGAGFAAALINRI